MAKKLDQRPFLPQIPDEISNSEKARRLADSLGQIWGELSFFLFALGPENFSEAGLRAIRSDLGPENFSEAGLLALRSALGVPICFSEIGEGETIAEGTLVIYNGRIRVALQDQTKDSSLPPSTGEYWDYAS